MAVELNKGDWMKIRDVSEDAIRQAKNDYRSVEINQAINELVLEIAQNKLKELEEKESEEISE